MNEPPGSVREPFVRLKWEPGLYGVTKLCWREWPRRNVLSWVLAAGFVAGASVLLLSQSVAFRAEPRWHVGLRLGGTAVLAVTVAIRLVLEGTVSKPAPGEPPPWDRKLVDPWWTTIHTMSGIVLGLWLTPFAVTIALTVGWEALEVSVPGFGDEEVNGNRLVDNGVAWIGWLLAIGVFAAASSQPLPWW